MKLSAIFVVFAVCARAETKTLTLKQALDRAMEQNPDVLLSRLDQQKARDQILIAKDPFYPKVYGGGGYAWTNGYPVSIDGNPPSIFQAHTDMALFDRQQSYKVAEAKEGLRGSAVDVVSRQEDAAYKVALLFFDAEQAAHSFDAASKQIENLAKVKELMDARVAERQELATESKRANLNLARAKHTADVLHENLINAEMSLAQVLGMAPDDRVRAAEEERAAIALPVSEDASIEEALEHSPELRRLESNMQMKTLEIKSFHAARLPKLNLVAQDDVFAKYNYTAQLNYKFRYNNPELGASVTIPLLIGKTARAYSSQAEADVAKLRIEVARTRSRITADLRRAYQEVKSAQSSQELARDDLDLTREELSEALAQYGEGRLPLARVETLRALENEKFLAFYVSRQTVERARLNVLRLTGTLLAALK
ncbi:MAG TPA: TolC family protein [Bryobacteraceae bacterium]|jgi:outer membrane protein|nr:TolC family protein [Bryobacteraceae bacterium]